ncbi:MAG: heavy-metal-associated domain-containing protein [Alistipes sp.]
MKTTINVENIRCGGCSNSIHKSLAALTGIFGVEVDIPGGKITIEHTDEVQREQMRLEQLAAKSNPLKQLS